MNPQVGEKSPVRSDLPGSTDLEEIACANNSARKSTVAKRKAITTRWMPSDRQPRRSLPIPRLDGRPAGMIVVGVRGRGLRLSEMDYGPRTTRGFTCPRAAL